MKKNERKDLVTNIYTADPSAHVFNGKIYIYPSHDEDLDIPEDDDGEQYVMKDYHILSMDSLDSECVDNGVAISEDDIPWVSRQLWAPDAVYTNGKYYLVFPAKDKDDIFRIGVAESDSPVGPFKPQENYIQGSYSIDPAVLLDDDGRIWCYNGGLWGGQLEMWQSGSFNPNERRPEGDDKALAARQATKTAATSKIRGCTSSTESIISHTQQVRHTTSAMLKALHLKVPSHTREGSWSLLSDGQHTTQSYRSTASGTSSITMQRDPADAHTRDLSSSQSSTSQRTARSRRSILTITSKG